MQANSGLITGNLRVLGKIHGPLDWSDIINKPSTYTPSAHTHGNADLTGIAAWAKSATKPSYAWSEITDKPSWIGSSAPSHLPLSGGTMTGSIVFNIENGDAYRDAFI